jgi:hypothetical protein
MECELVAVLKCEGVASSLCDFVTSVDANTQLPNTAEILAICLAPSEYSSAVGRALWIATRRHMIKRDLPIALHALAMHVGRKAGSWEASATKEVKAKLSTRLTNALTQLVSSKLIRDSGARRERRFFK